MMQVFIPLHSGETVTVSFNEHLSEEEYEWLLELMAKLKNHFVVPNNEDVLGEG